VADGAACSHNQASILESGHENPDCPACRVDAFHSVHAAPAADGDPAAGKALHDKSCVSCHASMLAATAAGSTRAPTARQQTAQQLAARVSACNANTGAGWFPEDEAHVAAYLNQQFYKFK
jgi:mono/diheme cytochrome c family protein